MQQAFPPAQVARKGDSSHTEMLEGAPAIEAVADALIRLEAKLPADVVVHLYPRFPAQTISFTANMPGMYLRLEFIRTAIAQKSRAFGGL